MEIYDKIKVEKSVNEIESGFSKFSDFMKNSFMEKKNEETSVENKIKTTKKQITYIKQSLKYIKYFRNNFLDNVGFERDIKVIRANIRTYGFASIEGQKFIDNKLQTQRKGINSVEKEYKEKVKTIAKYDGTFILVLEDLLKILNSEVKFLKGNDNVFDRKIHGNFGSLVNEEERILGSFLKMIDLKDDLDGYNSFLRSPLSKMSFSTGVALNFSPEFPLSDIVSIYFYKKAYDLRKKSKSKFNQKNYYKYD